MQKLNINIKNADGTEGMKTVEVVRSFLDASLGEIFLFPTGVYGYKDGAPILTEKDLDIIGPPGTPHRMLAQRWWETRGKQQSAAYYQAMEANRAAMLDDFQEDPSMSDSELDTILYQRRKGKGSAISAPLSWQECGFTSRPDWWGQAANIAFKDVSYEQYIEESPVPDKTSAPASGAGPNGPAPEPGPHAPSVDAGPNAPDPLKAF